MKLLLCLLLGLELLNPHKAQQELRAQMKHEFCFETEDKSAEICISPEKKEIERCKSSPLGWKECRAERTNKPGLQSSCSAMECDGFGMAMCGPDGVFMLAFYPYGRGQETSCIVMCRQPAGGIHEDTCGGMAGSSPQEPIPGTCGECPGACSPENNCCYPDCPEDQIPL